MYHDFLSFQEVFYKYNFFGCLSSDLRFYDDTHLMVLLYPRASYPDILLQIAMLLSHV